MAKDKLFEAVEGSMAVIFDFDGTLYDMKGFAVKLVLSNIPDMWTVYAERKVRRQFDGADCKTPEDYSREFFKELSKRTKKSPSKMRLWFYDDLLKRNARVLKKHYKPREGFPELFEKLNGDKVPFAIFSSYPLVAERLEALGFDPAKSGRLYSPDDFGAQKPAVRPFIEIARDLGVKPADVLVIGDKQSTDGDGARAAGMKYIDITEIF
jgi:HAD superfamily hydrolase (TIGR01549 family)